MTREDEIQAILERTNVLVDDYTERFDALVNQMVPPTLANHEYAARCGGLMIALNRELARCAATFGEVHGIDEQEMILLVGKQFVKNHELCLATLRGQMNGQTVQ